MVFLSTEPDFILDARDMQNTRITTDSNSSRIRITAFHKTMFVSFIFGTEVSRIRPSVNAV